MQQRGGELMPISTAVVEDDSKFLAGLRLLFKNNPAIELTGIYSCGKDAVAGIIERSPDVALIDLGLPDMSGVDVIRELRRKNCRTEMIVLTVYNDDEHLFPALKAGASGYIVKDEISMDEIKRAIDEVVRGGAPMSMEIARRILSEFREGTKKKVKTELEGLTKRENEVLEYLARGYSTRKVADTLNISYETVRSHQKNIYRKLQVNSLIEAVAVFRE
jgi:DNA-binding NarL/FixJ family response regulator